MTRIIYGTTNLTTTGAAVQFSSDTSARVLVASVHARSANTGSIYLGTDSNVSSASGWELNANDEFTQRYKDFQGGSAVKPSAHWMSATSTSQKVDYWFVLEN